jgi:hypothetical protein
VAVAKLGDLTLDTDPLSLWHCWCVSGASDLTRRVSVVNANWTAGSAGEDGSFALLIVTEDGERHSVELSPAAAVAVVAMTQSDTVLLWDPEVRSLIVANLVGHWLDKHWSAATRPAPAADPEPR